MTSRQRILFLIALSLLCSVLVALTDLRLQGKGWSDVSYAGLFRGLARNVIEQGKYALGGPGTYIIQEGPPNYATMDREPGAPILLGGIYALAGTDRKVDWIVSFALHAAMTLLTYRLALFLLPASWAFIAGIAAAVDPAWLAYTGAVTSDETSGLALAVSMIPAVFFLRNPGWATAMAAGLAFGMAALFRFQNFPIGLLAGMVVLGWTFRKNGARSALLAGLFYGMAFLGPQLPWALRNVRTFDSFRLGNMRGWITVWNRANLIDCTYREGVAVLVNRFSGQLSRIIMGQEPNWGHRGTAAEASACYHQFDGDLRAIDALVARGMTDQLQHEQWFKKEALERLRSDPLKYLVVAPAGLVPVLFFEQPLFLDHEYFRGLLGVKTVVVAKMLVKIGLPVLIWTLCVLGIVAAYRRQPLETLVLLFPIVTYLGIFALLAPPQPRYAIPLIPMVFAFCAAGARGLFGRLRKN